MRIDQPMKMTIFTKGEEKADSVFGKYEKN